MKAISPVIATVIIVSVAIAISIAVALWLTGITSGFTQTENLQIISSYSEAGTFNYSKALNAYIYVPSKLIISGLINGTAASGFTNGTSGWYVRIDIKNTGTVPATIDNIFINNVPISSSKGVIAYNGTGATIDTGKTKIIYIILLNGNNGFTSGQMVNIKIHTASGRDYPTTITLP